MQIYHFIEAALPSTVIVVCDHASSVIPDEFGHAPLSAADKTRHISHDIGAAEVSRLLGAALPAHVFLSGISRLVVDLNRDVACEDVIPIISDGTRLPFNEGLSDADRTVRLMRYHLPYHIELHEKVQHYLSNQPQRSLGVLIHSFTPCLAHGGKERPWHMGLLWRDDEVTAKKFKTWLEANTTYSVGDNEPYTAFSEASYTMRKHFGKVIPHIAIEIRQDLIRDAAGQRKMAELLAEAITAIRKDTTIAA